jgi:ArsR family transcriptional regulator, arsenate/arsenite/antimonite-responsive transcriptional repressor
MKRDIQTVHALFKALADPTRIRILSLLANGEICVCHIHDSLQLPQSLVSRHLAYLRRAGLVAARKQGLWVHYRLAEGSDAVERRLLDAVYHYFRHIPAVAKDAKRLEKETGCCAVPAASADGGCCSAVP